MKRVYPSENETLPCSPGDIIKSTRTINMYTFSNSPQHKAIIPIETIMLVIGSIVSVQQKKYICVLCSSETGMIRMRAIEKIND